MICRPPIRLAEVASSDMRQWLGLARISPSRLLGNYAYRLREYCPGTAEVVAGLSRVLKRVLRLFLSVLFSAFEYLS